MATASETDSKTVVRRFIKEIVNDGNYEIADDLIAETYTRHDPGIPDEQHGPSDWDTLGMVRQLGIDPDQLAE